jgi:hypothetical protein
MKRDYQTAVAVSMDCDELHWRTVFHEAGHAAAIHLRNQQQALPPVFFEIQIKRPKTNDEHFSAKVIGGNLIQSLPIAVIESFSAFSRQFDVHSCQRAYEADIVNLLVGPLAEANYIALRDNELLNARLVDLNALHHYGGQSDLEHANQYLQHFIACPEQRAAKLRNLLIQAHAFIENRANWRRIEQLAQYLMRCPQEIICCEDAITILDGAAGSHNL